MANKVKTTGEIEKDIKRPQLEHEADAIDAKVKEDQLRAQELREEAAERAPSNFKQVMDSAKERD